ncbi:DUF5988 family protein [Actinomadura sp. NPDC000600]
MNDAARGHSTKSRVDAVLIGGPDDLPKSARTRQAESTDRIIKIMHRGGYEHFELDDGSPTPATRPQRIFRWTMRTRIAE